MNDDEHSMRPGLFGFEVSHHKTMETSQRRDKTCLEVRLTKRTLVGSSFLLKVLHTLERCFACVSCVRALDARHVSPLHCPTTRCSGRARKDVVVGWLLNVPATFECISGTDLLRQFYVLTH